MKNQIELLAPAGNWEALIAAVENGADAVYLGGSLFNARQYAGNFDDAQLKAALDYAHIRGVKIYLTMNTLLSDREIEQAIEYTKKAYIMGIDAIIVQDIGFASLVRKQIPGIEIHGSTQMTIYNSDGVNLLKKMGFKRVVLARELSIEEIRSISLNTDVEIEIFIHGALCVSYSGQCLMSSMIGGRSGNRGKCAQPCRLPYELVSRSLDDEGKRNSEDEGTVTSLEKGYLMSPKDICLIDELGSIISSGVKSLKIEGRMKSPEYVATVVRIYRKYLDDAIAKKEVKVNDNDMKELLQIFNRGGFSKGYLLGKTGRAMMSWEKPKNWGVYLGKVISLDKKSLKVRIKLEEDLSIGDGIEIWNNEDESPGNIVTQILHNGNKVEHGMRGSVVDFGDLKGNINKGNVVYKTSDKSLNIKAKESFSGENNRKIDLKGTISVEKDKPIIFVVEDSMGNKVSTNSEYIPEEAITREITEERLLQQLHKTGSTPYQFTELNIKLDKKLSVSVGKINEIRRIALEDMSKKRIAGYEKRVMEFPVIKDNSLLYFPGNNNKKCENNRNNDIKISLLISSTAINRANFNFDYSKLKVDRIYFPFKYFLKRESEATLKECKDRKIEIFSWIPSTTRGKYDKIIKEKTEYLIQLGLEGVLVGNLGTLDYFSRYPELSLSGNFNLNVFNSFSIEELKNHGLESITLSPEMMMSQIEALNSCPDINVEAIVYGRIPLMTSEYCPVGSALGNFSTCSKCSRPCSKGSNVSKGEIKYCLKDRKGIEFSILCDDIDCRSTILNSNILFIIDSLDKIRNSGVNTIRIDITDESIDEIYEIVELHKSVVDRGMKVREDYRQIIEKIKSKGFTKGHYFRGV